MIHDDTDDPRSISRLFRKRKNLWNESIKDALAISKPLNSPQMSMKKVSADATLIANLNDAFQIELGNKKAQKEHLIAKRQTAKEKMAILQGVVEETYEFEKLCDEDIALLHELKAVVKNGVKTYITKRTTAFDNLPVSKKQ